MGPGHSHQRQGLGSGGQSEIKIKDVGKTGTSPQKEFSQVSSQERLLLTHRIVASENISSVHLSSALLAEVWSSLGEFGGDLGKCDCWLSYGDCLLSGHPA